MNPGMAPHLQQSQLQDMESQYVATGNAKTAIHVTEESAGHISLPFCQIQMFPSAS